MIKQSLSHIKFSAIIVVIYREDDQTKAFLSACDVYAFDGLAPDLEFICKDGTVPAHQFILAGQSQFLQLIFNRFQDLEFSVSDWGTGQMFLLDRRRGAELLQLTVPDIEIKHVKMMLDLFYRGIINLSSGDEAAGLKDVWRVLLIDTVRLETLDVISEVTLGDNQDYFDPYPGDHVNSHESLLTTIKTEIVEEVDMLVELKSGLEVECEVCKDRFKDEEDMLRHMEYSHNDKKSMYDRVKYKRAKHDEDEQEKHPKDKGKGKGKGKGKSTIETKPLRKENMDVVVQHENKKVEEAPVVHLEKKLSPEPLNDITSSAPEDGTNSLPALEDQNDDSSNDTVDEIMFEPVEPTPVIKKDKKGGKKTKSKVTPEMVVRKNEEILREKRPFESVTNNEPSPKKAKLSDKTLPSQEFDSANEAKDEPAEDERSWEDVQCLVCDQEVPVFADKPGQNRRKYQTHLLTHFYNTQYPEIPEGLRVYQCSYNNCSYAGGNRNPYIQHIAFKHDEWYRRINRRVEQAMKDPDIGDELEELSAVKEVFLTDYRIIPEMKLGIAKPLWVDGTKLGREAEIEKASVMEKEKQQEKDLEKQKQKEDEIKKKKQQEKEEEMEKEKEKEIERRKEQEIKVENIEQKVRKKGNENISQQDNKREKEREREQERYKEENKIQETTKEKATNLERAKSRISDITDGKNTVESTASSKTEENNEVSDKDKLFNNMSTTNDKSKMKKPASPLEDSTKEIRCKLCPKVMKIDPTKVNKNKQSYQMHLMESHFVDSMFNDIPTLPKYYCPYHGCEFPGADTKERFRVHLAFTHKEFSKRINRRITQLMGGADPDSHMAELQTLRDIKEFFQKDQRVLNPSAVGPKTWASGERLHSTDDMKRAGPHDSKKASIHTPVKAGHVGTVNVEISADLIQKLKAEDIKEELLSGQQPLLPSGPQEPEISLSASTLPASPELPQPLETEMFPESPGEAIQMDTEQVLSGLLSPCPESVIMGPEEASEPPCSLNKEKREIKAQNLRRDKPRQTPLPTLPYPRPPSRQTPLPIIPSSDLPSNRTLLPNAPYTDQPPRQTPLPTIPYLDLHPSPISQPAIPDSGIISDNIQLPVFENLTNIVAPQNMTDVCEVVEIDSPSKSTLMEQTIDRTMEAEINPDLMEILDAIQIHPTRKSIDSTGTEVPLVIDEPVPTEQDIVEEVLPEDESILELGSPHPNPSPKTTPAKKPPVFLDMSTPIKHIVIPAHDPSVQPLQFSPSKSNVSSSGASKEVETSSPEVYTCKVCKKEFVKRPEVIMHIICDHMQDRFPEVPHLIDEKYKCVKCPYSSAKRNGLLAHLTLKHQAIMITDVTDLIIHNDEQLHRASIKSEPMNNSHNHSPEEPSSGASSPEKNKTAMVKIEVGAEPPKQVKISKKDQTSFSWKCKGCKNNFVSEDGLRQHIIMTHLLKEFDSVAPKGLKIYSCEQCFKYSTVSRTNFIKHMGMQHQVVREEMVGQYVEQSQSLLLNIDVITCRCDKQFDRQRQLRDHIIFTHYKSKFKSIQKGKERYRCKERPCPFKTLSRVALIKHLVNEHDALSKKEINKYIPVDNDDTKSVSSSSDDSVVEEDSSVDFNDSVSQAPQPTPEKQKSQRSRSRSHSDEIVSLCSESESQHRDVVPFANNMAHECPVCGKVVAQRSNFEDHLQTHGIEQDPVFQCGDCDMATSFAQLYLHLASVHRRPTGSLKLACLSCDESFTASSSRTAIRWLRTHCTEQTSKARHQSSVQQYVTGARQALHLVYRYSCQLCTMYFKTTDNLAEHGKKFGVRCFQPNQGMRQDPIYTVSTLICCCGC